MADGGERLVLSRLLANSALAGKKFVFCWHTTRRRTCTWERTVHIRITAQRRGRGCLIASVIRLQGDHSILSNLKMVVTLIRWWPRRLIDWVNCPGGRPGIQMTGSCDDNGAGHRTEVVSSRGNKYKRHSCTWERSWQITASQPSALTRMQAVVLLIRHHHLKKDRWVQNWVV